MINSRIAWKWPPTLPSLRRWWSTYWRRRCPRRARASWWTASQPPSNRWASLGATLLFSRFSIPPQLTILGGSTIQDNFSGSSLCHIDHAIIPPILHSQQAQLFEKTVGSPVKIIVFEMNDELMRVRLEGRGNFDDRKDAIRFLRIFACSRIWPAYFQSFQIRSPFPIRKRIDNYNEGTKPVIQAYSKLVKSVSGL